MNVCMTVASSPLKVHEAMRSHIFYLFLIITRLATSQVLFFLLLCFAVTPFSVYISFALTTNWAPRNPWGLSFIGLEM